MLKGRRISVCCVALLTLLLPRLALADEVRLKNGDHISGEIISMEKELLVIRADLVADKISIEMNDIDCIISPRNLPAVFQNDEVVIGTLSCPEDGKVAINSESLGALPALPLGSLQAINPANYKWQLNVGGDLNSGNSNTSTVNVATKFQVRTHKHRFTVDITHNYGEASGVTIIRNSSGSLKYDFFSGEKLYSYAQSLNEEDAFANLNLRNTDGLGMGYQFSDTRKLIMFAELGVSFFNEDVIVGEDKRTAAVRWAIGFDWEFIPKKVWLYHHQEGYYNNDDNSYVMKSDQGIRIPMRDNLAVNVEVDYRTNSAPLPGEKNNDTRAIIGLTYLYTAW